MCASERSESCTRGSWFILSLEVEHLEVGWHRRQVQWKRYYASPHRSESDRVALQVLRIRRRLAAFGVPIACGMNGKKGAHLRWRDSTPRKPSSRTSRSPWRERARPEPDAAVARLHANRSHLSRCTDLPGTNRVEALSKRGSVWRAPWASRVQAANCMVLNI